MALDEKIFKRYLIDGVGVLRLYRWSAPSFTYGFSQRAEDELNLKQCLSDGVQVSGRITGGGVLFHHDEITYSFVCDKSDVNEKEGELVSYSGICLFLVRFYESLGLKASFACNSEAFQALRSHHGFCSASREKYDILINGRKIGGNAQKRKREVMFQHGSIPCSVDWDFVRRYYKRLPEKIDQGVTALSEEMKCVPQKHVLEERLINAFAATFNANFIQHERAFA